jgi:hypothetical protein
MTILIGVYLSLVVLAGLLALGVIWFSSTGCPRIKAYSHRLALMRGVAPKMCRFCPSLHCQYARGDHVQSGTFREGFALVPRPPDHPPIGHGRLRR